MKPEYPTLLHAWKSQVAERPDAVAVYYFDAEMTFAQVDSASDALAVALAAAGLQRGERLALYLQNDPQWLVGLLAGWKLGAIPAAVNPMLREKELTHHLTDSGAAALLCLDSLVDPIVKGALPGTQVRTVVTTHPLDLTPDATLPAAIAAHVPAPSTHEGTLDLRGLLTEYAGQEPESIEADPDDIGVLTYTSGTTGRAKGAMNTQRALVHSSTVFATWNDLAPDRDVVLGLAPVFHITGIVAGFGVHIATGAPITLLHRFDAEETLRAIERRRCTFTVGASTAFIALSNHPSLSQFDVSSLTITPSGGAAVSTALVEKVRAAAGWELFGVYGMTETTSPVTIVPRGVTAPVDEESGALSVGVAVPGAEVRIVDPVTGADLPLGEAGEIVVRGPMVVPGYWQLPGETAHAIRDGWLHTGDIGKMADNGWLFVVDRLKDMINAGGYKIYPRDVEDVLLQHPAVKEVSVVGVPDEYRGETVRAYLSLVDGAAATPEELITFCKERMAAYKYPRSVVVLDELPKNASGKLLRRELRALA